MVQTINIAGLPAGQNLTGSEVSPWVQSGATKRFSLNQIASYLEAAGIAVQLGYVDVELFGASVDSASNDAAFQSWLEYLNENDVVGFIQPRTYRFTGTGMTLANATRVRIRSEGATLDFSACSNSTIVFNISGTTSNSTAVTSSIAVGAASIAVASGAEVNFPAGSEIKLYSDDQWAPARTPGPKGELCFVSSNSTPGTITLNAATFDSYATNPTILLVAPVVVQITGALKLIGNAFTGSGGQQGIIIEYGIDCLLDGITTDGIGSANLVLSNCINSYIRGPGLKNVTSFSTGYGIVLRAATQACYVEGGWVNNCRHAITTASGISAPGLGSLGGVVRNCIVSKFTGLNSTGDTMDTHASYDGITYIDCVAKSSQRLGFNLEGGNATLIRCKVYFPANIGFAMSAGVAGKRVRFVAIDCYQEGGADDVMQIGPAAFTAPNPEPAGVDFVEVRGLTVLNNTAGNILTISKPSTFVNAGPTSIRVSGIHATNSGSHHLISIGYCNSFSIDGVVGNAIPTGVRGIQLTAATKGTIEDVTLNYVASASATGIIFQTGCSNITFDKLTITGTTLDANFKGVVFDDTLSNIRSPGNNTMADVPAAAVYYPGFTTISSSTLTIPIIVRNFVHAVGDGANPSNLDTINGGKLGDILTIKENPGGDITVRHNQGNIFLVGGANCVLATARQRLTLLCVGTAWHECYRSDCT
jgi:hypothetical protein